MRRRNRRKKRILGLVIMLATIVLLIVGYFVLQRIDDSRQVQTRGAMTEGFGQQKTLAVGNKLYKMKWDVETFLLLGVDKTTQERVGYRDGGLADVIFLIAIDHDNKQIYPLQINRDTMTPVPVTASDGSDMGLYLLQINTAHIFGQTIEENNQSMATVVSNFMDGIPIDGYMSMDLENISALNHLLGGVTVTIEDDFSAQDPAMIPGATIKLTDAQAAIFLHSRISVGDGTNISRMRRHRTYLSEAINIIRSKLSANTGYANEFLTALREVTSSNVNNGLLINELNRVYHYTIHDFETLEGTSTIGETGLAEFYADQASIDNWVIKCICEQ